MLRLETCLALRECGNQTWCETLDRTNVSDHDVLAGTLIRIPCGRPGGARGGRKRAKGGEKEGWWWSEEGYLYLADRTALT